MDNIAGSPVEGENFYGREKVVTNLREILTNDDILLLGPRRIGKTSAARAVMAVVRNEGWRAVEINVGSCKNERDFLDKLESKLAPELASFSEKAKNAIGDAFGKVSGRIQSVEIAGSVSVKLGSGEVEDWIKVASDVLRLIVQADGLWMIFLDELPIMLFNFIRDDPQNGVQRVRRFLDWFRNDVRALQDARKVRWLVSGSVGLDTLVQEHGMADTINSMRHQGLDAYSDDVAIAMLAELATSYKIKLSNEDALYIVDAVQWPQPYYLQMVFHHLRVLVSEHPYDNPASMIDKAIDIMIRTDNNDFHYWEERLAIQLSKADAGHARALLNLASRDSAGARAENLLDIVQERMSNATPEEAKKTFIRLRDILLRDAYWWAEETSGVKRYRFRLEPLRRWWFRRNTL